MSCFLDTKVQGLPCSEPMNINKEKPEVVEVKRGMYHGGGLYPIMALRPYVISPCIFSPTRWVRRRLTGNELCLIKDIPEDFLPMLSSSEIAVICQDKSLIPLKVMHRVLDMIADHSTHRPVESDASMELRPLLKTEFTIKDCTDDPVEELRGKVPSESDRNLKSARADDAEVPEYL
jgi:hypothetical protein